MDINTKAFLALVRAGLWEKEARLLPFGEIDFATVQQLAEEQSVVGLVASGLEHVTDIKVPKKDALQFIGQTLQIEERNKAMNCFIGELAEKMSKAGIYSILVKGQGVALCYERPFWRACGDVDLLLDIDNYKKAQLYMSEIGKLISQETRKNKERLNSEYEVAEWMVELHGTQHANLSNRMDKLIDGIQKEVFSKRKVRVWKNGQTDVFLPAETEDVLFVFSHILQHLFLGGIGLRQVCDWCRQLWTYQESLDCFELEALIRKMNIMTEWKAFSCIAVVFLGFPVEVMPFYDKSYSKKAERLLEYILEVGNFGHNKDFSYINKYSGLKRKTATLLNQIKDSVRLARIFPVDSPLFLLVFVLME